MAREELEAASESLREAAERVDDADAEERIYEQSRQFAGLATADRGPDHGRLARHENILHDLIDSTAGEASERVQEALEHVQSYREGVEGV